MDFDVLVFVCRGQPFHRGHETVVREGLKRAKKVIIVPGSHDQAPNIRNPLTTAQRIEMITGVFPQEVEQGRVVFSPQVDHPYNDAKWAAGVQAGVYAHIWSGTFNPDPVRIGLIGHSKDETSFYLKIFQGWDSIEVENVESINSTDIRNNIFRRGYVIAADAAKLPLASYTFLVKWTKTDQFKTLKAEFDFIQKYKKSSRAATEAEILEMVRRHLPKGMENAGADLIAEFAKQFKSPYAPSYQTVDAVVLQSAKILLVKRKAAPGKGLLALPGGFLDVEKERLLDGAIRELKEETRIDLPEKVLRGSIVHDKTRTFDAVNRSARGRTITTAFLFNLPAQTTEIKVKGADDAEKAFWKDLGTLRREDFFEDHYDIICEMTGI